ncbi:MAG: hypothetical protein V3U34_09855 [candidate division NC10 bacterium]
MLWTSQIFSKLSGTIGGTVASHNRGGQYLRALVTPVNPNTSLQQAVRTIFANLAAAWSGLTDLQRAAWDDYAANVPVINRIGDSINLTGFNMYIRSNTPREQVGLDRVDDGPTDFTLPALGDVSFAAAVTAGLIDIAVTFDNSEPWAAEVGGALLVNVSRQMAPTINFFKGPFNAQDPVLGAVMPPVSPDIQATTIPGTVGNIVFAHFRVTRLDGRLSTAAIQVAEIA